MKKYRDQYFKRAKKEHYPARSVYKLQELDKRFRLLQSGQRVLDLGAAPGSWTLFAAKKTGPAGLVVAVDKQETATVFPATVQFFVDDIFSPGDAFCQALGTTGPFHVVLSDMAPATTGHRATDQARSMNLCEQAFGFACNVLRPQGHFVVKLFQGPDEQSYRQQLRQYFTTVKSFKPNSSRAESKEIFLVSRGFKATVPSSS